MVVTGWGLPDSGEKFTAHFGLASLGTSHDAAVVVPLPFYKPA